jgi:type I restriction enzyme S subunit
MSGFDRSGAVTVFENDPKHSLPSAWIWTTIEEICTIIRGSSPRPAGDPRYFGGTKVPWITVGSLTADNRVYLDSVKEYLTDEGRARSRFVEPETLLLTNSGATLGVPKITRIGGCINDGSVALLDVDYPLKTYLYFYLTRLTTRLRRIHQGAAQPNLNTGIVKAIPVPVAPTNEQRRIVAKIEELFSDLDAGVAALKRAKANLKRYRAAVLNAAVEGKIAEEWRAKHPPTEPGSNLLTRILTERRKRWESDQLAKFAAAGKEPPKGWRDKYVEPQLPDLTDVPKIPAGWAIASMDQLTLTITSGSRDWSQYYGEGTGTFIMAQNVRAGQLDLNFRQKVNPPGGDRDRARSQVQQDDLLVTIVGANTGDVCRVDGDYPEHYVCQSVALMRPVLPGMSHFIEAYLVSQENGQRQFRRFIYGQGRPHLGFDQLRVTPVLLPSIDEQAAINSSISEKLSQIDAAELAIDHGLSRATRLRQSILKQAFEGKLVQQDPHDESASVLLQRLRGKPSILESDGITAFASRGRGRTKRTPRGPK